MSPTIPGPPPGRRCQSAGPPGCRRMACRPGPGSLPGMVVPWLLLLLRQNGPSYGYDILARLPEVCLPDAATPTAGGLYRQLRRLEDEGFVKSEWRPSEVGPDKRYYELTSAGDQLLADWASRLAQQREVLERFLQIYEQDSSPPSPVS